MSHRTPRGSTLFLAAFLGSALQPTLARAQTTPEPQVPPPGAQPPQAPGTEAQLPAAAPPSGDIAGPARIDAPPAAPNGVVSGPATPDSTEKSTAAEEEAALAAMQSELGATDSNAAAALSPSRLNLYGFADFTYSHPLKTSFITPPWGSFAVGNINLYLSSEIGEGARSLIEVRYTYLPHGSGAYGNPTATRVDNTYPDYVDLGRPMRVGGIELERAWVEYDVNPYVTVRAGQFLSPYGIWNVDHGSPVFIGVVRPYIVGEELIPERQTGLEVHGAFFHKATQFGYHLTLSNGRGPIDAYKDLDNNKALGGRLYIRNDSLLGNLQLGASFYKGRYTDRGTDQLVPNSDGALTLRHPITTRYDEFAWAADLKWEWSNFLLQSEFVLQEKAFIGDARPSSQFSNTPGLTVDHRNYGTYVLAGYRTPFLNTMPFFTFEYIFHGGQPDLRKAVAFVGGLNVRPMPNLVFKGQYTRARFPGSGLSELSKLDLLAFQTAWSF